MKKLKFIWLFLILSFSNAFALTSAPQAIVYDMQSKQVLFEKDSARRMYPASMTKIMTAYIVLDSIKNGNITMKTKFKISSKSSKKGGSRMFIRQGSSVSVKDLMYGLIIQSGNDAAIALAEGISGTEESFARLMNLYAKRLGMNNTNFVNATGWPDKKHYTTSKDLVKLSVRLIRDFPEYYHIWAIKSFTYNNIKQFNRNPLLYKNIGADGLKTGHTEISGYGLVGSVKRNDRRLIIVLNGMRSKRERSRESLNIAQDFLFNYENKKVLKAGQVLGKIPVHLGNVQEIPIVSKDDLIVSTKVNSPDFVQTKLVYQSPLIAPVKKGQQIGIIKVMQNGQKDKVIPVYAGTDAGKMGLFNRMIYNVKNFIMGS